MWSAVRSVEGCGPCRPYPGHTCPWVAIHASTVALRRLVSAALARLRGLIGAPARTRDTAHPPSRLRPLRLRLRARDRGRTGNRHRRVDARYPCRLRGSRCTSCSPAFRQDGMRCVRVPRSRCDSYRRGECHQLQGVKVGALGMCRTRAPPTATGIVPESMDVARVPTTASSHGATGDMAHDESAFGDEATAANDGVLMHRPA